MLVVVRGDGLKWCPSQPVLCDHLRVASSARASAESVWLLLAQGPMDAEHGMMLLAWARGLVDVGRFTHVHMHMISPRHVTLMARSAVNGTWRPLASLLG